MTAELVTPTRSDPAAHWPAVTPREAKCFDCPQPGVVVEATSPYWAYRHYRVVPADEPMFVGSKWLPAKCRDCLVARWPDYFENRGHPDSEVRPCAMCSRLVCGRTYFGDPS